LAAGAFLASGFLAGALAAGFLAAGLAVFVSSALSAFALVDLDAPDSVFFFAVAIL
jgi:hypothetical protein